MAIVKKQLTGDNLCNTSCTEKKNIIHPENCVEDVLMSSEGDTTLQDWIMGGLPTTNNTEPVMPNTLMGWLSIYYSDEHIGLPIASSNNIGGIKIGNTLSINNNSGVTNVNLNNIIATADDLGVVKIGNGLSINNEGILSLNSLPTASDRILGCININNTIEGLNLDSINTQIIDSIRYVPLNSINDFTIETVYAVPVNIVKTSTSSRDDNRAFMSLPTNLFNYRDLRNKPENVSVFNNDAGYLTSETDPVYSESPAASITQNDIAKWNAASNRGNFLNINYFYNNDITISDAIINAVNKMLTNYDVVNLFGDYDPSLNSYTLMVDLGDRNHNAHFIDAVFKICMCGISMYNGKFIVHILNNTGDVVVLTSINGDTNNVVTFNSNQNQNAYLYKDMSNKICLSVSASTVAEMIIFRNAYEDAVSSPHVKIDVFTTTYSIS